MFKSINKRLLILVLLTTIVVLAGISSLISNQKPKNPPPQSSPQPQSNLKITPFETEVKNITHDVYLKPVPIPVLYLYETSLNINESEILEIFGFTNTPPTREQTSFKEWFIPERGKLFIHSQPNYVYFKLNQDTSWVKSQLDRKFDYENKAKSLLSSIKVSDQVILLDVVPIKANEYNQVPASTFSQANLISYYFAYNQDNLPLIMTNRPPASIIITLTSNGNLFDLTYYPKPQIISKTKINPISQTKAIQILQNNKGILLSIESNISSETSFTPNFTSTSISRQSFLYYYSNNQIIPTYYFGGNAVDTTREGVKYNLKYLVPAQAE